MNRLNYIRNKFDITQKELAEYLGIPLSTYNQYEKEERCLPLRIVKKISKFFNVSIEEIFLPSRFTIRK